jgi:DNA repair protein RadD
VSFLESIESDLLLKWISKEIGFMQASELDRLGQENVIRAIFGNSLLKSRSRFVDFILQCDQGKFDLLCQRVKVSQGQRKKLDIAIEIASKPFTEKSLLSRAAREIFLIDDFFMPIKEMSSEVESLIEPVSVVPPAYDYQLEIIDKLRRFLASDESAVLMQLPTGSGKTRVALQSIAEHLWTRGAEKNSFVWLAHTQELCQQAYETFKRMWVASGNEPIKAYCLWGGRKAIISNSQPSAFFSTFGTFSAMHERGEYCEITSRLHCIFIDEAHRASSKVFGGVVKQLKRQVKIIGLTATPGRHAESDVDNLELKQLFDSRLITSTILGHDPIKNLQERGILGVPKIEFIVASDAEIFVADTGDVSTGTLEVLSQDDDRNEVIVRELSRLVMSGHKILVFSCSVDHSKLLVANLAARGILSAYVDSDMSSGRRMGVIDSFSRGQNMVLVNYGILSTGFDVPDISAVVITRPTSSIVLYSQMLGRGMRGPSAGGSEDFVVLDIRDNTDSFGKVNEVYSYFDSLWQSGQEGG